MRLFYHIAAILAGLLSLAGCQNAALLNATIPTGGMQIHKDIAYGADARQKLDVYVPQSLQKTAPVVVFFYGGSWKMGSKNDYLFIAEAFASKGYVVVIPDYRLYPHHYYPTFMEDSARAVAWVHSHIKDYKGEARNLFLAGHSAGAYNAVMLAVNERFLKQAGGSHGWIRGVIGIAGPYDFLPLEGDVKKIFSKAPDKETQPINYVGKNMPPMLLVHGDDDEDVLLRNTLNMTAALRAKGNEVEQHTYHDIAHIGIILSMASGFRDKTPLLEQADRFIRAHAR